MRITVVGADANGAVVDINYVPPQVPVTPSGGVHTITAPLQYYPITVTRLIDSRGEGGKYFTGETRTYSLYTVAGVPNTAVAFAAGLSGIEASSDGYLSLWPASAPRPEASSLNYQVGIYSLGSVYSGVARDGTFRIFAFSNVHVIMDITGYFAPAGASGLWFNPYVIPVSLHLSSRARSYYRTSLLMCFFPDGRVPPFRVFDTRQTTKITNPIAFPFRGVGAIAGDARAVSFCAGMVDAPSMGFLTVWPEGPLLVVSAGTS